MTALSTLVSFINGALLGVGNINTMWICFKIPHILVVYWSFLNDVLYMLVVIYFIWISHLMTPQGFTARIVSGNLSHSHLGKYVQNEDKKVKIKNNLCWGLRIIKLAAFKRSFHPIDHTASRGWTTCLRCHSFLVTHLELEQLFARYFGVCLDKILL